MKHEKLIAAWDSILPDAAADERMRSEIMAYQRTYRQKDRSIFLGRYVPAAACLVLVLAAAVWFGLRRPQTYTVTLENGQTLVYETGSETARSQADADYGNTKSRPLTGAELYTLFPAVSGSAGDAADAIFRAETGALIHAEGTVGGVRFSLSDAGLPATDTVVTGREHTAVIKGVPVRTGCFVTKPNSQGVRTAIFYAAFRQNQTTVYAELAGAKQDSKALSQKLSDTVYGMVTGGLLNCSAIRYE